MGRVQGARAADESLQFLNRPNKLLADHCSPCSVCQRARVSGGGEVSGGRRGEPLGAGKAAVPQEQNGLRDDLALRSTPGPQLAAQPPAPRLCQLPRPQPPRPGTPDLGAGQLLWGRPTTGGQGELLFPTPR